MFYIFETNKLKYERINIHMFTLKNIFLGSRINTEKIYRILVHFVTSIFYIICSCILRISK